MRSITAYSTELPLHIKDSQLWMNNPHIKLHVY